MLIILAIFGYMIWGIAYVFITIIQVCLNNPNGKQANWISIIVVDIIIMAICISIGNGFGVFGIIICFAFSLFLIEEYDKATDKKKMMQNQKEKETQDVYDNEWGIIEHKKK